MEDLFLEARAQLAHVRMAAAWLNERVVEHLGELEASSNSQSQADFFALALHPALSVGIVLAVFSLLEQAIIRVCERHAAYDKKGARRWNRIPGAGSVRAIAYLEEVGGPAVRGSDMLRDLNDLRLVRNQLTHRGTDFSSAPKNTLAAARRHGILKGITADPHRVLELMMGVEAKLLDALQADFGR